MTPTIFDQGTLTSGNKTVTLTDPCAVTAALYNAGTASRTVGVLLFAVGFTAQQYATIVLAASESQFWPSSLSSKIMGAGDKLILTIDAAGVINYQVGGLQ